LDRETECVARVSKHDLGGARPNRRADLGGKEPGGDRDGRSNGRTLWPWKVLAFSETIRLDCICGPSPEEPANTRIKLPCTAGAVDMSESRYRG